MPTECLNCGAHVTDRFAKVFGDNDDQVHNCTECDTDAALLNGTAAGLERRHDRPRGGASA